MSGSDSKVQRQLEERILASLGISHGKVEINGIKFDFDGLADGEVYEIYAEPDVIALGDYNGDGSYYDEGAGPDLAGFDPPAFITAIPDSADTTVAASSNTYDRMELSESMASDFDGLWGVIEPGKLYDVKVLEGTKTTAGTEEALSDHYPVWGEFYINQDTD